MDRLTKRSAWLSTAAHAVLVALAIIGTSPPPPPAQPPPPPPTEANPEATTTPDLTPPETTIVAPERALSDHQLELGAPPPRPLPALDQQAREQLMQGDDWLEAIQPRAASTDTGTPSHGDNEGEGTMSELPAISNAAITDLLMAETASSAGHQQAEIDRDIERMQVASQFISMRLQDRYASAWRGRFRRSMRETRPLAWLTLDQRGRIERVQIIAGRGTGVDELDHLIESWFHDEWRRGNGVAPPPFPRDLVAAYAFVLRLE